MKSDSGHSIQQLTGGTQLYKIEAHENNSIGKHIDAEACCSSERSSSLCKLRRGNASQL